MAALFQHRACGVLYPLFSLASFVFLVDEVKFLLI
jgi:hypothetical protein